MWLYIVTAVIVALFTLLRTRTPHILRDVKWLVLLSGALRGNTREARRKTTAADLLERRVDAHPNKEAISFVLPGEDFATKTFTWREVDEHCNQVANWAIKRGLKQGTGSQKY